MNNLPYIVGLSGGIGSGKTEATVILKNLGAYIIDADSVSHEISQKGKTGYNALKKEFPDFFDAESNLLRRELRAHIFSNNLTDKLNEIMFPIIISEVENRILSCEKELVFVVAPLLIESGMHKMCNSIISIITERQLRIDRIVRRDNIDSRLAGSMIDAQLADNERIKLSDIVIYNDGNLDALARKVQYYYEKIKQNLQEDN